MNLPCGFAVRLDSGLRWLDAETLLGGAPPRIMRLSPHARELLREGTLTVTDKTSDMLARRLLDAGLAHPTPAGEQSRPVSVVIPVCERASSLRRLLDTVAGTLPAGSEIIVVDDGSRAKAEIATAAGEATVLRHHTCRGPAAARNTGLARAHHPFVAFLDSDVVPHPGWLSTLLAHFDDPAVALVAPRIVALAAAREDSVLAAYERVRSSLDLGAREARIVPRTRVAYVPSAALVMRADAVTTGFDERMSAGEDVDLVCRLHRQGWGLRYEPAALVAHEHRDTVRAWATRKAFYGTSAAPLALRHPGTVPPMNLPWWSALACLGVGTGSRWARVGALVLAAASTVALSRSLSQLGRPLRTAAQLNGWVVAGALRQAVDVSNRHWWPITLLASLVSRRVRRAAVLAALAEGLADWARHGGDLDPVRYLAVHRADDIAYGAGLWWGAWRHRTLTPLLPRLTGFRRARRASRAGDAVSRQHRPQAPAVAN